MTDSARNLKKRIGLDITPRENNAKAAQLKDTILAWVSMRPFQKFLAPQFCITA